MTTTKCPECDEPVFKPEYFPFVLKKGDVGKIKVQCKNGHEIVMEWHKK